MLAGDAPPVGGSHAVPLGVGADRGAAVAGGEDRRPVDGGKLVPAPDGPPDDPEARRQLVAQARLVDRAGRTPPAHQQRNRVECAPAGRVVLGECLVSENDVGVQVRVTVTVDVVRVGRADIAGPRNAGARPAHHTSMSLEKRKRVEPGQRCPAAMPAASGPAIASIRLIDFGALNTRSNPATGRDSVRTGAGRPARPPVSGSIPPKCASARRGSADHRGRARSVRRRPIR